MAKRRNVSPSPIRKQERKAAVSKEDGERTLWQERWNIFLLVLLYMLQGLPLGLASGSLPVLLVSQASLTQIGLFSISSYPYTLKILYAPIIDSIFPRGKNSPGRRRTWIIPLQLGLGAILLFCADIAQAWVNAGKVSRLTWLFFAFVFLAASQDVAVDGWSLTMLARNNLAYASMCQTIGMNLGYALSYPVFLALNDAQFSARLRDGWLRRILPDVLLLPTGTQAPLLDLASLMRLSGILFVVITGAVLLRQEAPDWDKGDVSRTAWDEVTEAYRDLWAVMQLKPIHKLVLFLLSYRAGTLAIEALMTLQLVDKGVTMDSLAANVLLQVPLELVMAVVAGYWTRSGGFSRPWGLSWALRIVTAGLTLVLVVRWPDHSDRPGTVPGAGWFLALQLLSTALSFASTVMFTAQGAFYSQVADPSIGGAYLTLLNTVSNLGYHAYRPAFFYLVDKINKKHCVGQTESVLGVACGEQCAKYGGTCRVARDGFLIVGSACLTFAIVSFPLFFRLARACENVPEKDWRVHKHHGRPVVEALAEVNGAAKRGNAIAEGTAAGAAAAGKALGAAAALRASQEGPRRRLRASAAAANGVNGHGHGDGVANGAPPVEPRPRTPPSRAKREAPAALASGPEETPRRGRSTARTAGAEAVKGRGPAASVSRGRGRSKSRSRA